MSGTRCSGLVTALSFPAVRTPRLPSRQTRDHATHCASIDCSQLYSRGDLTMFVDARERFVKVPKITLVLLMAGALGVVVSSRPGKPLHD